MATRAAETATLLGCCPDRRGIVAALAQVLYGHGANILDADQHTDTAAGIFFQRIRFDLAELHTDRASLEAAIAEIAQRLHLTWRLAWADTVKRVAIFVSRFDHCLYDLLLRHRAKELACEIPLVVSNHPDHKALAEQFGCAYRIFPISAATRAEQEAREIALLEAERIDLVVLARYMQVLSEQFLERWNRPVINIHHSFLPAFSGGKPYHQAYERGVKLIGATAHYATDDLDEGPIIDQEVARVDHTMTPEDLVAIGADLESVVLNRAVKWHAERRVVINEVKTVVLR
jgi:formyltetrahydrofolate deformylase